MNNLTFFKCHLLNTLFQNPVKIFQILVYQEFNRLRTTVLSNRCKNEIGRRDVISKLNFQGKERSNKKNTFVNSPAVYFAKFWSLCIILHSMLKLKIKGLGLGEVVLARLGEGITYYNVGIVRLIESLL